MASDSIWSVDMISGMLVGNGETNFSPVALPDSVPASLSGPTGLYFTRNLSDGHNAAQQYWDEDDLWGNTEPWFMIPDTFVTINPQNWSQNTLLLELGSGSLSQMACSEQDCSNDTVCKNVDDCIFSWLSEPGIYGDLNAGEYGGVYLIDCLNTKFPYTIPPFRCGHLIIPTSRFYNSYCVRDACAVTNIVSLDEWNYLNVDSNLQTFVSGGLDSCGVYWPGQAAGESFAQALGGSLTRIVDFDCSLESPCKYELDCRTIGSYSASMLGQQVLGVQWGLPALISLQIINQQLNNQYIAIKGALGILALDTFSISDFFPSPDGRFNIVNALTGLGTILSVVSGFVPTIGPGIAATGAILPAVGTFLGNAAASSGDPEVGQKEFAPRVRDLYSNYIDELDKAGTELFKGGAINTTNGAFNITDMMANGAWANASALTKLPALEKNLTIEILSRSIDALWKTPTSNKMWILFVDLADDLLKSKCLADSSGPGDSKYCDNGGVYYAYNFIEDGDLSGYVDYPWGGQLLQSKLNINLTVSNRQNC